MRPKNLTFPSPWGERRPAFYKGVLIIPQHYDRHEEWDFSPLFATGRPVSIEYCSGNGHWVIEKAKAERGRLWIAIERQFGRVRKIWSKMRNEGIDNLLIVCGEALTFTRHYFHKSVADEIFVNFPDPWPKTRHAKHRLIQSPFVGAISQIVKPGGRAIYATDHPQYARQIIDQMELHPRWESVFPKPYFISEWEEYGWSWFQDLWEKRGHHFHFIQYRLK